MKKSCAVPEVYRNASRTEVLTSRETEVLTYLIEGLNNKEIAKVLIVSVNTIKAHVSSILEKLNVDSRVKAAVKAIKLGIVK